MVAVVVKEKFSRSLQLLAQGTADIVLDSCVEFWNGRDLCPLSPADRLVNTKQTILLCRFFLGAASKSYLSLFVTYVTISHLFENFVIF